MSSLSNGDNSQNKPAPVAPRPPNADELLAEFEKVLEMAGLPPVAQPSPEPLAPAADSATRLRSRRRMLATSGLVLGLAAVAGVGLYFMPSARAPRSPLTEDLTQRQSRAQPPVGAPAALPGRAGGPPAMDGAPSPDPAQAGRSDVETYGDAAASASAPVDARLPAGGSHTAASPQPSDSPARATAASGAPTLSDAPPPGPAQSGPVKPDSAPIVPPSSPAMAAPPVEATPPHDKAPTAVGVKMDSAKPPAAKIEPATKPTPDKPPARKSLAKTEKAKTEPDTPYPPRRPAPPVKAAAQAAASPAAQAAAEPASAPPPAPAPAAPPAPMSPTSFAAQSVGQVTNALGYLTRLPGALIQRATGSGDETK